MFGEAIVGLGLILPGEAAVLFYSATVDSVAEFLVLWGVMATCIVAGSVVGFEVGRRVGPTLRESRVIRRHGADRWDRATALLRRHGTWAVFLGRLTPFVRSVVPAVAGAAGMSYRTFLPAICAGAVCSSVLPVLFVVGMREGLRADSAASVAILVVVLLGIILLLRRNRRRDRSACVERRSADDVQS